MTYSNPAAYRRFKGRWSAQLAPPFIGLVGVENGQRILDVGCGTGSLSTALLSLGPGVRVVGIDPVPDYVSFTHEVVADHRAHFETSAAEAMLFPMLPSMQRSLWSYYRRPAMPSKQSARWRAWRAVVAG
jgi:2-polyprenyl-3-methyl-5-hydroxy-6-metoxy-1,4-benzoquinol methylase